MKKKIIILGSTGSIGTQALETADALGEKITVTSLSARSASDLFMAQIKKYRPKSVCVESQADERFLKSQFPSLKVYSGEHGLCELCEASDNADLVLVAVSGKAGLKPTLSAIKNGLDVAIANKETLVMAGEIVMRAAHDYGVRILPVDSEHSAIHQCLERSENGPKDVKNLIITGSGGPFLNKSIEDIKNATIEQTLAHPRWSMGKKITVDSATLMNKGLEVIEAHHLFNIDYNSIKVVIHPQSIIHGAVEYNDGSVIAQLGLPSMHIPIQYALSYPERVPGIKTSSFDFFENRHLEFLKPDLQRFPCLELAFEAGKLGTSACAALNAANEEAVFAFLAGKTGLWNIVTTVEKTLSAHKVIPNPSLEDIFEIDKEIRQNLTKTFI